MLKNIATYIFDFILAVSISILFLVIILFNTVLNKNYILKELEIRNYYEKIYYEINNEFGEYVLQSGLEENDLDGIFDQNTVEIDVKKVIEKIYANKPLNIDTANMIEKLDKRIKDILKEKNRNPDVEENEAIKNFEDTISETYINNIIISKPFLDVASNIYTKVNNSSKIIILLFSIISIVLVFIIKIINKEIIKYIGVALLTSGILNVLIKVLIGNRIYNILLINQSFSDTFVELLRNIINIIFATGVFTAFMAIMIIFIGNKRATLK